MHTRFVGRLSLFTAAFFLAASVLLLPHPQAQTNADPWSKEAAVNAPKLVRELNDPKTAPMVVYVGFQRLYTAGHIKGAQFHGSGGSDEGMSQLKSWAASLPRTTNLVIYCGCCPVERCPNIRPAFTALRELGFTHLRVLVLPTSFDADWAGKGYPYDKGK